MFAERYDICLGIVSRERKEVNLTYRKHKSDMLRQKVRRMEGP
jgi:hypothetical protein